MSLPPGDGRNRASHRVGSRPRGTEQAPRGREPTPRLTPGVRLFRTLLLPLQGDQDPPVAGRGLELGRPVGGPRPGEAADERVAVELVDARLLLAGAAAAGDVQVEDGRLLLRVHL